MPALLDDPDLERKEVPLPVYPDRFEVIAGEIVEIPEMGAYSSAVGMSACKKLVAYEFASQRGRTFMDMTIRVPLDEDESRERRPDVCFVSYERWPAEKPIPYSGNALEFLPELAVEVASPSDSGDKLFDKADEYLRGGVRVVWLIYPLSKVGMIFETGRDVRVVRNGGSLDGGTVFPDLTVPLAGLFPPVINE
jgi:Uma2 family endonuclease